ncbi:MAG: peptide deformylase [PS1 clade bacterium]|uniref:Peptide deformylase n=1 Tax=PS1 clade bacterium TaxID=2175152 RepID=A0A937HNJ6_9PROT|nr:peptide deformylase [PS1 clade bacterium]
MTIRPIIEVPDARLKTVSQPVAEVSDETRALMDDMLETMYDANGIGLAAIQVGVASRIIVMDISPSQKDADKESDEESDDDTGRKDRYDLSGLEDEGPRFFVNPEIVWTSDEMNNYQEGCLSVPGFYDDVERPAQCRVKFLDYDGKAQEIECDGLLATCIQHEMDHLNGIVFLDHLSRLKRQMIVKKLQKAEREKAEQAAQA